MTWPSTPIFLPHLTIKADMLVGMPSGGRRFRVKHAGGGLIWNPDGSVWSDDGVGVVLSDTKTRILVAEQRIECPACGGHGTRDEARGHRVGWACPACGGEGWRSLLTVAQAMLDAPEAA